MSVEEFALGEDNFLSNILDVSNVVVTIISEGDKIVEVQAEFHGSNAIWQKIQNEALFAYTADICGPIMGGSFSSKKEFIFTIGLHPDQVTLLSILADSPATAFHTLLNLKQNPSFVDIRFYRLLSVMQQVTKKTQWGMSTTFAKNG